MSSFKPLKLKLFVYRLEQITLPWNKQKSATPPLQTPVDWTLVTPTVATPVRDPSPLTNVKFTAYGIPYPVEYANVTFKRAEDAPPAPPPKSQTSSPDWTLAGRSAEARAEFPPVPKSAAPSQGVFIWHASQSTEPPKPMPVALVDAFRGEIQRAVAKVGMQGSPAAEGKMQGAQDRLFKGTYKQVVEALSISGMATIPCPPEGPQGGMQCLLFCGPTC